ncbi:protein translocase subunit SecD [Campylobacter geochelonis]|uniref:Protein translocase subunit SecD n=1 Tax=Campylobacter geochelonis TaxID=1780362 RepID=A0A128EG79_9BACT|nr:protein translocase subunit SecD [Campylobacter geochelonis]QKF70980.1 protein-export membrane protein SecD [Campylobacter geochelonis]CZE47087.1 preprotein translocase subunit SecD [Campylobacter geochelonis]CZE47571.1 preprotein translocase subunit SecD [Campylobacter geochelonis]CZE50204.1 preprotein translocase subunit SecD [Campylobacter geochelonis]
MRSGKITYRLIIFFIATIFSIVFSIPSFLQLDKGHKINLGLDLQGGLHMLLGVETNEAIHSKIKSVASSVSYSANKDDLLMDGFRIEKTFFEFTILDPDEASKFDAILKNINGLNIQKNGENYNVSLTPEEEIATKEYAIDQAVETIRNRLDQFGLAEPIVARQGKEDILVEIPGVKTQEDEQRAKDLIAKAAHLQLMALDDKRQDQAGSMSHAEAASYGDILLDDAKAPQVKYVVKQIPVLDGGMLVDAKVAFDQHTNQPIINFTLNSEGAAIFGDFTGKNVGKRLAIVLDNKVYSAPRINERIGGGSGQISGGFTLEEARDVAIALRSGALLAPVKLLEKRSIGPSLGQESIDQSTKALVGASILIVLFMMFYYGLAGVIANIALVVNILLLVSVMALFGATLTLPGMAGIVLTVGMAVDANVIINERIREILREGGNIRTSIKKGYENAMSAIIDSNLTTLITSAALYAYGTGPVKGFAVTMSIGIIASMLTAILGTHGIFDLLMEKMEKSQNAKLWFGYKVRKATNADI